jgi:hypothetical protein
MEIYESGHAGGCREKWNRTRSDTDETVTYIGRIDFAMSSAVPENGYGRVGKQITAASKYERAGCSLHHRAS